MLLTKEFTLIHLVTFSISRIRMKFYYVYSLIRTYMDEMFMNELIAEVGSSALYVAAATFSVAVAALHFQ